MSNKNGYQVSGLTKLEGLNRRLRLKLYAQCVGDEVELRMQQKQKQVRLPGFRQGKAPIRLVQQRYGPEIRARSALDLLRQACVEMLEKEKMTLAGNLKITEMEDSGEDVSATVDFEIYPVFKLSPLKKLKLERAKVELTEEDLEELLKSWQQQGVTYELGDAGVLSSEGDRLQLRMRVRQVGEKEGDASAREFHVRVGDGRFPPKVEAALVGVSVGDHREVLVAAPAPAVAGAEAATDGDEQPMLEYQFEVLEVAHPHEATLETMAASLEVEEGKSPLAVMRERGREYLQQQGEELAQRKLQDEAFAALLAANAKVPLPVVLVDSERSALEVAARRQLNIPAPSPLAEAVLKDIEEQALRRVRLSVLLRNLESEYGTEVVTEDVNALLEEEAQRYGQQAAAFREWAASNPEYLQKLRGMAFEKSAVKTILDNSQVAAKAVSLGQLREANSAL